MGLGPQIHQLYVVAVVQFHGCNHLTMMYKLYFRITKVPDGKNESGFIQEHENTKMEAAEEKADPIKEEKEGQAK